MMYAKMAKHIKSLRNCFPRCPISASPPLTGKWLAALCNSAYPIIENRAAFCQSRRSFQAKGRRAFLCVPCIPGGRISRSPYPRNCPAVVHPRTPKDKKFPSPPAPPEGLRPGGERTIMERNNVPVGTKERREGRGNSSAPGRDEAVCLRRPRI